MKNRINAIKDKFYFYGFLKSPLNNTTIKTLIRKKYDNDTIYEIGCDVYCGFNLDDILEKYYD